MTRFVSLVCGCLLAWEAGAAEGQVYYRVFKPPLDDYQGYLPPGDPIPTDWIRLIDLDGNLRGPFYKTNKYHWVKIPKPGGTPVVFTLAQTANLTNSLPIGTNYIAFVSPDNETVAISSTINNTQADVFLKGIFKGQNGDFAKVLDLAKFNLNVTYCIRDKQAVATLYGWDTATNSPGTGVPKALRSTAFSLSTETLKMLSP